MKATNVIIKIKNFFRRHKGLFEVWDTSAISTWFDIFENHVNADGINVIVPEGVSHEISMGRRAYEKCRVAYEFINEAKKNGKLTVYVTKDNMRSWLVDEQVVAIAYEYHKKGYSVKLVTCDRDQSVKADYRGLKAELLKGKRPAETETEKEQPILATENELKIPCITRGKITYVNVKQGMAVYDTKGKRKIGRNNLIEIASTDTLIYKDLRYKIQMVLENEILLKRMSSA